MKIMILANSSSGLYEFRKELMAELLIENEIIVTTPDNGKCEDLEKMGCELILQPVDRRGTNPIRDIQLLYNYYKHVKKNNPDLVITYTIKPNIYGGVVCRLLEIPYAINITGLGTAFQENGLLTKLVIFLYKIACKESKVVFFENSANRSVFLDNNIVCEKQACLLNGAGVNLKHFSYADYPEDGTIEFLFMGRVMAEKGIDELFNAMKMLVDEGIDTRLHVLGNYEEDYEDCIECYEHEGWLCYHGYQDDVKPFIHATHCFVLPSWHEGMANTNLECAASGRPIITSDIPGCKEAVIEGVSGYLVESKNARDLFCVMKKFIQLSYEEKRVMGIKARRHMEAMFDKNKVVEETIKRMI